MLVEALCYRHTHLPAVRWHYEEGLDVVFEQERVSLAAVSRLHLVISVQTLQRGTRDVHLPAEQPETALKPLRVLHCKHFPSLQSLLCLKY